MILDTVSFHEVLHEMQVSFKQACEFERQVNSLNDPVLDDFYELRLTLTRFINARLRIYGPGYWDKLPAEDQIIAHAEAAMGHSLLRVVEEAEQEYTREVLWPEAMKEKDAILSGLGKAIQKTRKESLEAKRAIAEYETQGVNLIEKEEVHTVAGLLHAVAAIAPLSAPIRAGETERILTSRYDSAARPKLLAVEPGEREAYGIRRYRDRLFPIESQLTGGLQTMLSACMRRTERNELTGAAANGKLLLSNENIPLPNRGTILGWYQLCNVATRRLTKQEQRYADYDWITTYIAPLLAVTKEHLNRGQIADEGSHVGWSLPTRSKAHWRDPEERIMYGIWMTESYLINEDSMVPLTRDYLTQLNIPSMAFHETALQFLPTSVSTSQRRIMTPGWGQEFLLDGLSDEEAVRVANYIPAAASTFETRDLADRKGISVIAQMAGISKHFGLYLRFDQTAAISEWTSDYLAALQWALFASADQRVAALRAERLQMRTYMREYGQNIQKGGQTIRFGNLNLG